MIVFLKLFIHFFKVTYLLYNHSAGTIRYFLIQINGNKHTFRTENKKMK
jgi:hypothetical protein